MVVCQVTKLREEEEGPVMSGGGRRERVGRGITFGINLLVKNRI